MSASSPSISNNRPPPIRSFDEIKIGQRLPDIETEVTPQQLIKFAGAVDDYAQPHWDQAFMVKQGFPGVIVHGWLTFSIMCRVAVNWVPLEYADYRAFKVHYTRAFIPGRAVFGALVHNKSEGPDGKAVEFALWVDDANGKRLAEGSITAVFA